MEPQSHAPRQEDLDAFLTSVESKLRGPFSSLDLAKAITTTALRGSYSPREYLQMLSQVLRRTEKVIQLRAIIALLGLDPPSSSSSSSSSSNGDELDEQIYQLLTQAQVAPAYEEWVRTVAGLVRGIMFTEADEESDHEDTDEYNSSCRGQEAQEVLDKTCQEILKSVRELEESTRRKVDEEKASSLWIADREPLFAPYRYTLVSPELLEQVIPECNGTTQQYFQVNRDASILAKDLEIEQQKAQEESKTLMARANSNTMKNPSAAAAAATASKTAVNDTVLLPGFRMTSSNGGAGASKSKAQPAKSSMFLTTKRPGMGGGAVARAMPTKTAIHARKAGAAQALVAKVRRPGMMNAGSNPTSATNSSTAAKSSGPSTSVNLAGRARVANQSQNRSKMKMIDVKEVEGLTKEQHDREKTETREQKLTARKRKIMEAAAEKGLVAVTKKGKSNGVKVQEALSPPTPPNEPAPQIQDTPTQSDPIATAAAGGALAQAVLLAYQQRVSDSQGTAIAAMQFPNQPAVSTTTPLPSQPTNKIVSNSGIPPDLRALLDKANKLAPEDRSRVELFFKERSNPTPDVPIYRMKLHENRTNDTETGQAVKETFYLELDYNTFETKQLRKVKRK